MKQTNGHSFNTGQTGRFSERNKIVPLKLRQKADLEKIKEISQFVSGFALSRESATLSRFESWLFFYFKR